MTIINYPYHVDITDYILLGRYIRQLLTSILIGYCWKRAIGKYLIYLRSLDRKIG